MSEPPESEANVSIDLSRSRNRWAAYWLMIAVALGGVAGRIAAVDGGNGTHLLSANDASRWCTIRALVDHGTYEIDPVILRVQNAPYNRRNFDPVWNSIDKVRHKGADDREHYYSSKPPLLPTMLAGVYWCIQQTTGGELETHPYYVGRLLMLLTNVPLLLLMLWMLASVIEQYGSTVWGRLFTMACGAFGTYTTAFCVSINNHLPGIVSVMLALGATLAIWRGRNELWRFALAGLCGAFAVANELPALSFFALIAVATFYKSPARWTIAFLPAATVVIVAFFYTNYIAHDSLRPPYTHRSDGEVIAYVEGDFDEALNADNRTTPVPPAFADAIGQTGVDISSRVIADLAPGMKHGKVVPRRWNLWDTVGQDRFAVIGLEGDRYEIREWDNWYEYDGTYWTPENKQGVDRGERSRAVYLMHMLIGHHGLFSLTPVWLIAVLGAAVAMGLARRRPAVEEEAEATRSELKFRVLPLWISTPLRLMLDSRHSLRLAAYATILISVVVTGFYLMRPEIDRNYGGVSCCMRWLLWMCPMWLVCLIPGADLVGRWRWGRPVALVLLAVSVASVQYSAGDPWAHPWLFNYWEYIELISYPSD